MEYADLLKKADEMITHHCGDQVKFLDQVALAEDIARFIEESSGSTDSTNDNHEDASQSIAEIAAACKDAGMKMGHRHGTLVEEMCTFIRRKSK